MDVPDEWDAALGLLDDVESGRSLSERVAPFVSDLRPFARRFVRNRDFCITNGLPYPCVRFSPPESVGDDLPTPIDFLGAHRFGWPFHPPPPRWMPPLDYASWLVDRGIFDKSAEVVAATPGGVRETFLVKMRSYLAARFGVFRARSPSTAAAVTRTTAFTVHTQNLGLQVVWSPAFLVSPARNGFGGQLSTPVKGQIGLGLYQFGGLSATFSLRFDPTTWDTSCNQSATLTHI